jgi:hypothetical protein
LNTAKSEVSGPSRENSSKGCVYIFKTLIMIKTKDTFGKEVTIGDTVVHQEYNSRLEITVVDAIDTELQRVGTTYEKIKSVGTYPNHKYVKTGEIGINWINKEFALYKKKEQKET